FGICLKSPTLRGRQKNRRGRWSKPRSSSRRTSHLKGVHRRFNERAPVLHALTLPIEEATATDDADNEQERTLGTSRQNDVAAPGLSSSPHLSTALPATSRRHIGSRFGCGFGNRSKSPH